MSESVKRWCSRCGMENARGAKFCPGCGVSLVLGEASGVRAAEAPVAAPEPRYEPPPPGPAPAPAPAPEVEPWRGSGRRHSPTVAVTAGLLIPGAGQAYNGSPIAGFFVLMTSVLVLPWLIGAATAYSRARRMVEQGGRFGKGGVTWIVLQAWLAMNVLLAAVLVLTMTGVLR